MTRDASGGWAAVAVRSRGSDESSHTPLPTGRADDAVAVPCSPVAPRRSRRRSPSGSAPGFSIASTSQLEFRGSAAGLGRAGPADGADKAPPCHSGAARRGSPPGAGIAAAPSDLSFRSSCRAFSIVSAVAVRFPSAAPSAVAGSPDRPGEMTASSATTARNACRRADGWQLKI